MVAYVAITRERARNAAQMEQCKDLASASFQRHRAAFPAIQGRHEFLEGRAAREVIQKAPSSRRAVLGALFGVRNSSSRGPLALMANGIRAW